MPRLRNALVLTASVILIASSGAHSMLGWPSVRAKLVAANAPADLIPGLAMGWHFAGVSMLAFGILTLWMLRVSGRTTIRLPLLVTAAAYLLFGLGCVVSIGWDPFLLTFLVPGALLGAGAFLSPAGDGSVATAPGALQSSR
jgi:hypothetical protein